MRRRWINPCRDLGEASLKAVRFDSFTVFQGLLLLVSREVSDNSDFAGVGSIGKQNCVYGSQSAL